MGSRTRKRNGFGTGIAVGSGIVIAFMVVTYVLGFWRLLM